MFQDKRQGGKSMTKEDVLKLLQGGGYVSGQRMSEQLGLSRAAIWKAIDRLRAEGYTIDSATNRGYRLTGTPNRLTQAGVERALGDHPWRSLVEVLPEVDSTNNVAKAAAAQGAPHGTVILSDYQTGGRGRRGRSFSSPQGMGVYCSVVLRYDVPPDRLLHLTAVIAEATRRAIVAATGLEPQIKWTNDLVLQDRKLCGILTELSLEAETGLTGYVIPGTGVNCGQRTEDFPAAGAAGPGGPLRPGGGDDPAIRPGGGRHADEPGPVAGGLSPPLHHPGPGRPDSPGRRRAAGPCRGH